MTAVNVRVGDQVFAAEGADPCGAVREVRDHELLVAIEGHGEFVIYGDAVAAVHDAKVVLDLSRLPERIRTAIEHAHDAEERSEETGG